MEIMRIYTPQPMLPYSDNPFKKDYVIGDKVKLTIKDSGATYECVVYDFPHHSYYTQDMRIALKSDQFIGTITLSNLCNDYHMRHISDITLERL